MTAIRCWCPSCAGMTYMRLSDWLARHELDRPEQLDLELVAATERHPSARS